MNEQMVFFVTGVASGIGASVAALARARGFAVVGLDRTAPPEGLVDYFVEGDVTSEIDNVTAVRLATRQFGRLDAAILNVGAPASGYLEEISLDQYHQALDVNTTSVVLGMRAAVTALRTSGGGSIVVTASNCGFGGDPHRWVYSAAKAAVLSLVSSTAMELARAGIRVNAVCPGPTVTGITRHVLETMPDKASSVANGVPMGRWGRPEEVAAAIMFLASPEASFITGVALPVDGGATAMGPNYRPAQ